MIKHTIRSNIGLKLYNLNPSLFFLNIVQITEKLEINILIFKIEIRVEQIELKSKLEFKLKLKFEIRNQK